MIEGALWTAAATILLAFVLFVLVVRVPRLVRAGEHDYPGKGWDIGQVIFAELAAFGLLPLVGTSFPLLLNPEYHAMIRLLERVVP